jgi:hypothetical protein
MNQIIRFRWLAAVVLFFVTASVLWAQPQDTGSPPQRKGRKARVGKDDVPIVSLETVDINTKLSKAEKKKLQERIREYERLRRNIRLVLPLAKQCAVVLNDVNSELQRLGAKKDKKYFMDRLEKELFQKYEHQIRRLTVSQGKLLIKLIHRETNSSAFHLIEEYRSWRSAAFWQLIATFFGTNLKDEYDPQTEPVIEMIVKQIETGEDEQYKVIYTE